jgi:hypothetical protein
MQVRREAETYLREAERCLLQAERASSDHFRERWLELAQHFRRQYRQAIHAEPQH